MPKRIKLGFELREEEKIEDLGLDLHSHGENRMQECLFWEEQESIKLKRAEKGKKKEKAETLEVLLSANFCSVYLFTGWFD